MLDTNTFAKQGMVGSVADPVHFFRIRICESGFINSDPDPGDPKRPDPTGSGSYLDMF